MLPEAHCGLEVEFRVLFVGFCVLGFGFKVEDKGFRA